MIFETTQDASRLEYRRLYDEHMRRRAWVMAFEPDFTPQTSRYVASGGETALVMWHQFGANLTSAALREAVSAEVAHLKTRCQFLYWKVYGHDGPPELGEILQSLGGEPEDHVVLHMADAAMVVDKLREVALPTGCVLHAGATRREIMAAQSVWIDVWPESADEQRLWGEVYAGAADRWEEARVADPTRDPGTCFWRVENAASEAVAAGYMVHAPLKPSAAALPIALLCGGAVVESARGQGLYKTLLKARAAWALSRGAKLLAIEASPMSAPIVQSLGFEPITPLVFHKFRF